MSAQVLLSPLMAQNGQNRLLTFGQSQAAAWEGVQRRGREEMLLKDATRQLNKVLKDFGADNGSRSPHQ